MNNVKTPWYKNMGDVPHTIEYHQGSIYDAVCAIAEKYPNNVAFDFMGKATTYKRFVQQVENCAKSP